MAAKLQVLNKQDGWATDKANLRAIQLAAHTVNNDATLLPNITLKLAVKFYSNGEGTLYTPGP